MKRKLGLAALLFTAPFSMSGSSKSTQIVEVLETSTEEMDLPSLHFTSYHFEPEAAPKNVVDSCFGKDLKNRYQRVSRFDSLITELASKEGFSPDVVKAVLMSESGGNMSLPNRQWSGAVGMGQIMDVVARDYHMKHLPGKRFKWAYQGAQLRMRKAGGKKWSGEVRDLYLVEQLQDCDDRVNPTKSLPVSVHSLGKGYRKSLRLQDAPEECRNYEIAQNLEECAEYIAKAEQHAIMSYYYPTSIKRPKWMDRSRFKKIRRASRKYYFRVREPLRWLRSEKYLTSQEAQFANQHGVTLSEYEDTCGRALSYVAKNGFPYLVSEKREPKKKK